MNWTKIDKQVKEILEEDQSYGVDRIQYVIIIKLTNDEDKGTRIAVEFDNNYNLLSSEEIE